MIQKYTIEDYKSFGQQDIELSALNLFSGKNSAGKTSAIQALLTAANNMEENECEHAIVYRHVPPMTFKEVRNYLRKIDAIL